MGTQVTQQAGVQQMSSPVQVNPVFNGQTWVSSGGSPVAQMTSGAPEVVMGNIASWASTSRSGDEAENEKGMTLRWPPPRPFVRIATMEANNEGGVERASSEEQGQGSDGMDSPVTV